MNRAAACVILLALSYAAAVRAQAPAAPSAPATPTASAAPAQGGAVLRTTSRLVEVNVIVQNKKGVPIDGLSKGNFAITDEGKPQEVAVFSVQAGAEAQGREALPSNTFANRLAPGGRAPGTATIILFDALNSSPQDQSFGRQQLIKFLRQLQPQDHVAIYLLTTRLQILHEFTYDSRSLIRAVSDLRGPSAPGVGDAAADTTQPGVQAGDTSSAFDTSGLDSDDPNVQYMESFLNSASGQMQDFDTINRMQTTAAALEAIAQHVRAVPGRKNLIWLSGSFPISIGLAGDRLTPMDRESRDFTSDVDKAARALSDVSLAVYPIDIRGLINPAVVSADSAGTYSPRRAPTAPVADMGPVDTMNEFASRTGGKAYFNGNDLTRAAREVMVDSQLTYQLGFYPTHGKWDGKFHNLKIRLVNVPGANARYRGGYFAVADPAPTAQNVKATLGGAVTSPVEFTGLSVQVRVAPPDPAAPGALPVDVILDPNQLVFAEDGGHHKGAVDLLFAEMGAGNEFLGGDEPHANLDLDPQTYESVTQGARGGITLERHLPLAPNAATLRVVVRDANSGAMGSVTIPLKSFLPPKP